jgi:hypothetical protein
MFIVSLTYTQPLSEVDRYGDGHRSFLDTYFEDMTYAKAEAWSNRP